MAESETTATEPKIDFLAMARGKRVIIETHVPQQPTLQPERYAGILEEVYNDSLLVRPDSGRLVLVYKQAIVSVSQADAEAASPAP